MTKQAGWRALIAGACATALSTAAAGTCNLGSQNGAIERVIYIQFDNTHFRRDNANIPSDLEQMPHLLDFIRGNGTLLTNDHTILISHTAGGILSSLTGLYPDRHGQTVSNSYVRTSGTGAFSFPSSFGYWTDPVSATEHADGVQHGESMTAERAGAVGAVHARGMRLRRDRKRQHRLENTSTGPNGDITKVFGNPSPQATAAIASAAAPAGSAARAKAQADFVGFAVHCAAGSAVCASGQNDVLPGEPGGYTGFKGLFGAQSINPFLTGHDASVALTDLLGQPVTDPFGQPGFPGFDARGAASLACMSRA
jgi:hypothetical protein